jgi:hypothetical protein
MIRGNLYQNVAADFCSSGSCYISMMTLPPEDAAGSGYLLSRLLVIHIVVSQLAASLPSCKENGSRAPSLLAAINKARDGKSAK